MLEMVKEIEKDKLIRKYLYNDIWLSGSSTYVYPITIFPKDVIIQINTKRNVFKKLIERYVNKYSDIDYAFFDKTDDTCPSELVFRFKKGVK